MTNQELLEFLKKELNNKKENPNIANWIFYYFNNINSLNELIPILKLNATKENECKHALYEYLINGKPLARIIKQTHFYKNTFEVLDDVFCPRVDTEILVDSVLKYIKNKSHLKILDMCCGTGVIGLSINKNVDKSNKVYLLDISSQAIKNTHLNANILNCNVSIYKSDLFENIPNIKFDVLISNPPYISKNENIESSVIKYDPYNSLFANDDGYQIYKSIISNMKNYLNQDSYLIAFEIGYLQAKLITNLLLKFDNTLIVEVIKDYNNLDRVVIARKNFNV